MVNRKILIIAILLVVLSTMGYIPSPQTVVPSCFEKEDCKVPLLKGYCSVGYDCVIGKCYASYKKCPPPKEICYGGIDEDLDMFKDCKDSDCFNSEYCPCERKSYTECFYGNCYCEFGKPMWVVFEDGHQCICSEGGNLYE